MVPGKIYISAMPGPRGLEIEQDRLHFRTIINLFDEASTQASPYHQDEIRFVREHGLRYLGSPSDGMESDRFLAETLALAQDPDAWPILVHCHGCMDRSPAWMGIYRFVVEGKPLAEIFREIERHRGSRPKAVVTLQYNRKLPKLAPDRFAADPTAQLLTRNLAGTRDPFLRPDWNPTATGRRVVTRIDAGPFDPPALRSRRSNLDPAPSRCLSRTHRMDQLSEFGGTRSFNEAVMYPQPIRDAHKKRPYQAFKIQTASGESYLVFHPEAMSQTPGGNTVVVMPEDESVIILDVPNITEIVLVKRRTPKEEA